MLRQIIQTKQINLAELRNYAKIKKLQIYFYLYTYFIIIENSLEKHFTII